MKLSEIRQKSAENYFDFVEIRKNPGNITEYISLLYGQDGKSCMLCNEDGAVVSSGELEYLISILKEAGQSKAKIYF
ncbi:hypothetical protein [Congregibacter sp.]|jgi:hypothetical protein|uniref:hypothetical protein n=1 Tax=Congregibacter sp. TaxID=2744308 RepID=UPI0039E4B27A